MIEFSNVLATYRRARYLTTAEAEQCLLEADRFLRPHYIEVRHHAALEFAIRHNITAYDARFLALASQFGARLVTEDSKLRAGRTRAHAIVGRSSGGGVNREKVAAKEQ